MSLGKNERIRRCTNESTNTGWQMNERINKQTSKAQQAFWLNYFGLKQSIIATPWEINQRQLLIMTLSSSNPLNVTAKAREF